jgi:hypothetical protein
VELIIVDGSDASLPSVVIHELNFLKNIKYIHKKCGFDARLSIASNYLTTKYVAMVGDDEFLTLSGIKAITNALDDSSDDVVGCIGQSIRFGSCNNSDLLIGPGYPHENYAVINDAVADRLLNAMGNYNAATCYAVLRRKCWIKTWGSISSWSSPYASELEQAIATYINGKFITVNKLYWLRSFDVQPIHHNILFNRKLSFSDWWSSNRFANEHKLFIVKLSEKFIEAECGSASEAEKIIRNSIATYVNFERSATLVDSGYLTKLKKITGDVLRVFMSEDSLDKIKLALGYAVDVKLFTTFDFGSLENFIYSSDSSLDIYGLDDALIYELRSIALLIEDFNGL